MLKKLYLVAYNLPKLIAHLLEASHFVSDAMQMHMVYSVQVGEPARHFPAW